MRRRWLAIATLSVLLSGCESYGDLTSDAFEPGSALQSQFTLDSARCAATAEDARNYKLAGIVGTHTDRHEIFNRALTACMKANGYVRRDWSPDIPSPYKIDPMPG